MQPVPVEDELEFERQVTGIRLTCNHAELPVDGRNLVYRAAERFLGESGIREGVRIHLEKRLPLAAGLGGGSANAAITLRGMNTLFGGPLAPDRLRSLAAGLGSDVPFFLQDGPALATGRGERVESLAPFPVLRGCGILLVHPGFGVSTAWAYRELRNFPEAREGRPGRAREVVEAFRGRDRTTLGRHLYNSLEAPVLRKYPWLALIQDFLRTHGALGALMSGSGSTTFAITEDLPAARALADRLGAWSPGGGFWVATARL